MSPKSCRPALRRNAFFARVISTFTATTLISLLGVVFASQFMFALPGEPSKEVQLTVTGKIPTGVATESYTASITAGGGKAPYVYKQSGLPKGLSIDSKSGVITGTSASTGNFSFDIYVTDAANDHGKGAFTVSFTQPPVSISLAPGTLTIPSAGTQQFLPTVLNTTNTSVTWIVSQGAISSTGSYTAPAVSSNTTVTIKATSAADNTKSATAQITVAPMTLPPVNMALVFPPSNKNEPYYADVQKYLLNNPLVSSVSIWLEWASACRKRSHPRPSTPPAKPWNLTTPCPRPTTRWPPGTCSTAGTYSMPIRNPSAP